MYLLCSSGGHCLGWRCPWSESILRTMVPLRSLVFCFLGLCASVSCSSSSSSDDKTAEAVVGPAGSVLKVTGSATATQEGKLSRALVSKDVIFSDDTIATGPASSLVIEISHNQARWEIGAGYVGRVDQSLSWRAKRQSVSALQHSESIATAAAGRNSEGEAAESQENLEPRKGGTDGKDRGVAKTEKGETTMAPDRVLGTGKGTGTEGQGSRTAWKNSQEEGGGGVADTGENTPGRPVTIGRGSGYGTGAGSLSGKASKVVVRVEKPRITGAYKAELVTRVIRRHLARLRVCYERIEAVHTKSGTVAVSLAIGPKGKVAGVRLSGDLQPIHQCVSRGLQHILFPKPSEGQIVKVQIDLKYIPQ